MSNPLEELERRLRSGQLITPEDRKLLKKQKEEEEQTRQLTRQRREAEIAKNWWTTYLFDREEELHAFDAVNILARQIDREQFVSRIVNEATGRGKVEIKYTIILARYQGRKLIEKPTGRTETVYFGGGGSAAGDPSGSWETIPVYKVVGTEPIELQDEMRIELWSPYEYNLGSRFHLWAHKETQRQERDFFIVPRTFIYHSLESLYYNSDFLSHHHGSDKMNSFRQSFYDNLYGLYEAWQEKYSK